MEDDIRQMQNWKSLRSSYEALKKEDRILKEQMLRLALCQKYLKEKDLEEDFLEYCRKCSR